MNTSTFISKEEFNKIRNRNIAEVFDVNKCYVVQRQELGNWITLCVSDHFDDSLYSVVNSSRYSYRVLKDSKDITNMLLSKNCNVQNDTEVILNDDNISNKPMKPSEYKAMSNEAKQIIINKVKELQSEGMKRNDIFHTLNVSEATYDMIRCDINSLNFSNKNIHTENISDNKIISAGNKVKRGSLLNRR